MDQSEIEQQINMCDKWHRSVLQSIWHLAKHDGSPDDVANLAELGEHLLDRRTELMKESKSC